MEGQLLSVNQYSAISSVANRDSDRVEVLPCERKVVPARPGTWQALWRDSSADQC
jgi:hypothetical protein